MISLQLGNKQTRKHLHLIFGIAFILSFVCFVAWQVMQRKRAVYLKYKRNLFCTTRSMEALLSKHSGVLIEK